MVRLYISLRHRNCLQRDGQVLKQDDRALHEKKTVLWMIRSCHLVTSLLCPRSMLGGSIGFTGFLAVRGNGHYKRDCSVRFSIIRVNISSDSRSSSQGGAAATLLIVINWSQNLNQSELHRPHQLSLTHTLTASLFNRIEALASNPRYTTASTV